MAGGGLDGGGGGACAGGASGTAGLKKKETNMRDCLATACINGVLVVANHLLHCMEQQSLLLSFVCHELHKTNF